MKPRLLLWTGIAMFVGGFILAAAGDVGMALIAFAFSLVLFVKVATS